ncbi:hypothetical protein [Hymenobacter perfusus]|uniref:hypothetical protein n=1 Tax=Hymenobacter perfusus TaxID=1236770 RepID=UPI00147691F1|nr:hypothetical protein [Hymenobacter perfusus]
MKPLVLVLLAFLLASCTLTPRTSKGRPLSPDHEPMAPDRIPPDSAATDSLP